MIVRYCLCILLAIVLCSCSRVQYVPIESTRIDSILKYQLLRDSIYIIDSVQVKEKGDTVYINKYTYQYKDKIRVDTMHIMHVDTIQVPCPIERKLNKWERIKIELGGLALGVLVITFGLLIVRYLVRRYGKR